MRSRLLGMVVAAGLFGAAACSDDYALISPLLSARQNFAAQLTGAAEKPNPVTTTASGQAFVTILDTNTIRVETLVSNIDSVTAAHIHAGGPNDAGPVMVFLFSRSAGTGRLNGVLSMVDIVRGQRLEGTFTFDELLNRIRNGTAYVNVHTKKNTGGEIRGQIVPQ